jgi:hypothetical protein
MPALFVLMVLVAFGIPTLVWATKRRDSVIAPAAMASSPVVGACLGCQGPLSSLGREDFRIGGTSGGWKLVFGELAEVGENKVTLDVFACQRCRRIELRMPG